MEEFPNYPEEANTLLGLNSLKWTTFDMYVSGIYVGLFKCEELKLYMKIRRDQTFELEAALYEEDFWERLSKIPNGEEILFHMDLLSKHLKFWGRCT